MAETMGAPKGKGFKSLPKGAQYALPIGGALVVYLLYKKYKAAQSSSSTTTATTATTPTPTDSGTPVMAGSGGYGSGGGGGGGGFASDLASALTSDLQAAGFVPSQTTSTVPGVATSGTSSTVGADNSTSASTGTSAVSITQAAPPVTFGGTTAQPNANEPTIRQGQAVFQGISNPQTAHALEKRGFTLYKNVNGQFVEANSAAGKASKNAGLYYNAAQSGVKK